MVQRTATGIASICFFNGKGVTDEAAAEAAEAAEDKAYARAKIESKTTTGSRPRCSHLANLCRGGMHSAADGCHTANCACAITLT